jgi:hypothetical protein
MSKEDSGLELIDLLRSEPVEWPKKGSLHSLLKKLTGADTDKGTELEIVYEDDYVVAFHELDADDGHAHKWDVRVTVAPKRHVTTLLDLGVGDESLTAALLAGVQKAALRLRLYERGFEVFAGVLPPYQRNSYLTLKIRSGKHGGATTPTGGSVT